MRGEDTQQNSYRLVIKVDFRAVNTFPAAVILRGLKWNITCVLPFVKSRYTHRAAGILGLY